ncbi:MAG: ammonium transporter, partial [Pseudomonadales bacterium]|nr:ammonium transporter [Pseudomonadales bacterium]
LVIGLAGGITCFYATLYIKRVLKIDDSLDVFPVHGVGGILGTFLAGVFASTELGVFSGFGFAEGVTSMLGQIKIQLIGIVAIVVFTAVASYILLRVVDALVGLRIEKEGEYEGLDLSLHEEKGYDL